MKKILFSTVCIFTHLMYGNEVQDGSNHKLIAHYTFDGNAKDTSGNNYDGKEYGNIKYISSPKGQAAVFDGIKDYIQIKNNKDFNFKEFTISTWIKLPNDFTGNGNNVIIHKPFMSHSNPYYQWQLGVHGTQYNGENRSNFQIGTDLADSDTKQRFNTEAGYVNKNEWTNVTITYSNQTFTSYINGKQTVQKNINANLDSFDSDIFIAKHGNLNREGIDFTPLMIDDLQIYNYAVNQSEVENILQNKSL